MRKSLSILLSLALTCAPLFATNPRNNLVAAALQAKGKVDKKIVFLPHAQANQDTVDASGKNNEKGFVVREWDGPLYVEASLIYWEGNDRTVTLVLGIEYPAHEGAPGPPNHHNSSSFQAR